jgi:hypothetical protein
MKTTKEQKVEACSLPCNILGVEGHAGAPRWDYEKWQAFNHSPIFAQTKQKVG